MPMAVVTAPKVGAASIVEHKKTPSKIRISKIEILNFPATDASGGGWDLTSGADLYPVITNAAGTIIWSPTTYFTDAVAGSTYSWDVLPNLDIDATAQYVVRMYDFDTPDPDDDMGGLVGNIFTMGQGFPTTLNFNAADGSKKFRFTVSYVF